MDTDVVRPPVVECEFCGGEFRDWGGGNPHLELKYRVCTPCGTDRWGSPGSEEAEQRYREEVDGR